VRLVSVDHPGLPHLRSEAASSGGVFASLFLCYVVLLSSRKSQTSQRAAKLPGHAFHSHEVSGRSSGSYWLSC